MNVNQHIEYRQGAVMIVCPSETDKIQFVIDFLKFHAKRLNKTKGTQTQ